jgi:hypothetical protein
MKNLHLPLTARVDRYLALQADEEIVASKQL